MSFTKLTYHIVFAPKNRAKVISVNVERDLYMVLYRTLLQYGAKVFRIGGMADHVHILVGVPPTIALSKFVQAVKRESSKAISDYVPCWPGWQEGYGAFSCSCKDIGIIKDYIANQKSHHRNISFAEEYRDWLIENGVSSDEPYFPR